jgi:hypothetical protein
MKVMLFNDFHKGHITFHILPGLSFFKTSYLTEIAFSWLIWTLEIRCEVREDEDG